MKLSWVFSNDRDDVVVTATHDEVDAVLDKVAALSREDWPAAAQVTKAENDTIVGPELYVGFHVDRGALAYSGEDTIEGSFSRGDGPAGEDPIIYMVGTYDEEFPPDSEIPLDMVRRAAHEFAETGVRPVGVPWQPFHPAD